MLSKVNMLPEFKPNSNTVGKLAIDIDTTMTSEEVCDLFGVCIKRGMKHEICNSHSPITAILLCVSQVIFPVRRCMVGQNLRSIFDLAWLLSSEMKCENLEWKQTHVIEQ